MDKGSRIEEYVASLGIEPSVHDPRYIAYFTCFNRREYYEAHDVLEHLWLRERDGSHAFYKGLIQFAGAFVHLKKQYLRPEHPKDRFRTRPAVRLFALAEKNLSSYLPRHHALDVQCVLDIAAHYSRAITYANPSSNPWSPDSAPVLTLQP